MEPSIGTILKINVSAQWGGGVTMDDVEFYCEFYISSSKIVHVEKSEMLRIDANNYVAIVDTSMLGTGALKVKIDANVPDTDCYGGIRREVVRTECGITIQR